MTALTPAQLDALRALRAAYPEATIALIGAAALAHHLPMTWRKTADLDLVITISVSDLDMTLSKLVGWKRHPKREQSWEAPNRVHIDIVPAPPDALEKLRFVWPETGNIMSLEGVRLALASAQAMLAPDVSIAIASVPVIILLKMAAYLDRPYEREKDLRDLAHTLNEYPPTGDDRFFTDDIFSRGFDEVRARGFILGGELRAIVNERERAVVDRFLATAVDGPGWSAAAASVWRFDEDHLARQIDAFRDGFAPACPD
jgi:predicted nucleotidyltransferase